MNTVFVKRDGEGAIMFYSAGPQADMDLEEVAEDSAEVVAFLNPPKPYFIAKTTPWLRMTDEEAVDMEAAMNAAPARLRAIYNAAQYLQSDDDLWPTLLSLISSTLSPQRAEELLAPEA